MSTGGNTEWSAGAHPAPRLVHLDEICQAVLRNAGDAACTKGLRVSLGVSDGFTEVLLQEDDLRRALASLVQLCVRLSPPRGGVGFKAALDRDEGTLHFAITTTHAVYLDALAGREIEGVRRRLDRMSGDVMIERRPDRSLALHVRVPFGTPSEERAFRAVESVRTAQSCPPPMSHERPSLDRAILLVEDDEHNVAVVGEYLDAQGFEVRVARDGIEAIERTRERCPSLILMDVQMPHMDGLTAMRLLRADASEAIRRVPIIALTALVMPGDRERCLEAGADAYVAKPVPLRHLAAIIEAQIRTHASPAL